MLAKSGHIARYLDVLNTGNSASFLSTFFLKWSVHPRPLFHYRIKMLTLAGFKLGSHPFAFLDPIDTHNLNQWLAYCQLKVLHYLLKG